VFWVRGSTETLLSEDLAVKPTWADTWLPNYLITNYFPSYSHKLSSHKSTNKKRKTLVAKKPPPGFMNQQTSGSSGEEEEVVDDKTGQVKKVPKKDKGPGRGVIGDGKVGGRRRKTIPRPSTPVKKDWKPDTDVREEGESGREGKATWGKGGR